VVAGDEITFQRPRTGADLDRGRPRPSTVVLRRTGPPSAVLTEHAKLEWERIVLDKDR
jgi:hypothetical protein